MGDLLEVPKNENLVFIDESEIKKFFAYRYYSKS